MIDVSTRSIDDSLAELNRASADGALVEDVERDNPAARAGLRRGSEEQEAGGATVRLGGDIIKAVDGVRREVSVRLGRRPGS